MGSNTKIKAKRRKFVRKIVQGKTQHQAYMETYPNCKSPASAKQQASLLMNNRPDELLVALHEIGYDPQGIAQRIGELDKAERYAYIPSNTKHPIKIPDYQVRLKTCEIVLKLLGRLTPTNDRPQQSYTQININTETTAKLDSIINRLEDLTQEPPQGYPTGQIIEHEDTTAA